MNTQNTQRKKYGSLFIITVDEDILLEYTDFGLN